MSLPTTSTRAGAAILLVDDNSLGLAARKSVLEELGYCITPASTAQEALDHFGKQRFELVITDYKMPQMNGLEFIARVRAQSPAIPVILISGFVDALGLDEKSTGADVVIQKSANEVSLLVRAVHRLLNRKPQRIPPRSQGARLARTKKNSL